MLIAITKHAGNVNNEGICEKYNHNFKTVETIIPVKNKKYKYEFIIAANNTPFDTTFIPCALSTENMISNINPSIWTEKN